jgi:tellurite resistance protein
MAKAQKARASRGTRRTVLGFDQALVALFIGAMTANGHVAADEAARAQHLIWSTRRFRRKSGDTLGKLILDMREALEREDVETVMTGAARAIPPRLRPSAFAVVADLLLADGRMDAKERRFLDGIGSTLRIKPETVRQVIDVVLLKNQI